MKKLSLVIFLIFMSCTDEKVYFENDNIKLTETDVLNLNYKFKSDSQKTALISSQVIPEYKKYVFARDFNKYKLDEERVLEVAKSKAYSENLLNLHVKKIVVDPEYINKIYNNSLMEFRYNHITIIKSFDYRENNKRREKINTILESLKQDESKFEELQKKYGVKTSQMINTYYNWGGVPYSMQLEIYKKADKGIIYKVIETSKGFHIIKVLDFRKKTTGFYPNLELFKKDYLEEKKLKDAEIAKYQDYYWTKIYGENNVEFFYNKIENAYRLLLSSNIMDLYEMKIENIDLFKIQNNVFGLHDLLYFNIGNIYDFVEHIRAKAHFFVPNYVNKMMVFQVRKYEAIKLNLTETSESKLNQYLYNEKYKFIEKLYFLKNEVKATEENMKAYYDNNLEDFKVYDRRFTYGFYLEGEDVKMLKNDYPKMTVSNLLTYYNRYFKYKKKKVPFIGMLSHKSLKNLSREVFKLKKNKLSPIIKLEGTDRHYVCYFNKETKGQILKFKDATEKIKNAMAVENNNKIKLQFVSLIKTYNKNSVVSL